MPKAEYALILNPESGSNDEEFTQKVFAALEGSGRPFLCLETDPDQGAVPAVQKAIESGIHTVIACGGDGTVMSTVNALGKAEADLKLAIVPGGTANLLARALSIPLDVEGAVEVALGNEERRIDLGVCEDTLFALGIGLGLTEKLVSQASSEEKERLGKWAYVKAMLQEVGAPPSTFKYRINNGPEKTAQGVAVVVANTGTVSGHVKFAPDAKMDDGVLDLGILHRMNALDLVRLVGKSLMGTLKDDRVVTYLTGKSIRIESDPPLDLQIDGETMDLHPPLQIEIKPGALRMAVPSEEQKAGISKALEAAGGGDHTDPVAGTVSRLLWWLLAATIALTGSLVWRNVKRK